MTASATRTTTIVVPCYDEARRLRPDLFAAYVAKAPGVHVLFVDDGSRDATLAMLGELAKRDPPHFAVLALPANQGKAGAVRAGMREAFARGHDYAGYWDADLATPLGEIERFVAALEQDPRREIVFGARVQLLGRAIERSELRHYAGRVFATVASQALGLRVYDTQCGAKLFRANERMAELFAEPFVTGWSFDVELLARLIRQRRDASLAPPEAVLYELPLDTWRDIPGSKVRARDFVIGLVDTLRIHRRYLRR